MHIIGMHRNGELMVVHNGVIVCRIPENPMVIEYYTKEGGLEVYFGVGMDKAGTIFAIDVEANPAVMER